MPFDSPLGSKQNTNQSQQPRKTFTVTDDTDFDIPGLPDLQPGVQVELSPQQFNAMQAAKQTAKAVQSKPTSEAKQRIELLTGIGRMTKEVVIDDHKFELQSLKAREMKEAVQVAANVIDSSQTVFELRAQQLARSLVRIDDHPVGLVLGTDSLEMRLYFINECEEKVVNILYSAFSDMSKEQDEKYGLKKDNITAVAGEIKKQ